MDKRKEIVSPALGDSTRSECTNCSRQKRWHYSDRDHERKYNPVSDGIFRYLFEFAGIGSYYIIWNLLEYSYFC